MHQRLTRQTGREESLDGPGESLPWIRRMSNVFSVWHGKPSAAVRLLIHDIRQPCNRRDVCAGHEHALSVALDAGIDRGGNVVFPRCGRVAQVVQVGVMQLKIEFIEARQHPQAYKWAA